ncbi:MAG: hypothetical protein GIS02_06570 [Methanosarcinales archaeon]|uniref:Uncharacterized protein n=1 Tax=Candidatus Ethanoperedens thermophilum TaxID=2766897 RepID=A0A848DAP6_9EURY|nr:hypothetical protein [Candidatus Ethanoperedens thermophilum]
MIDPDRITKNDLIECFQYILKSDGHQYSKERKKPSIAPSPPEEHVEEHVIVEEEKTEKPKKEEPKKKGFLKKLFS